MSIFSSLFGGSENQDQPVSNVNWIHMTDVVCSNAAAFNNQMERKRSI